jgi:hypothetical protein
VGAGGVGLVAYGEKIVEVGVGGAQAGGVAEMHLAPVRTTAERCADRLKAAQVLLERHADELVDRDVGVVPAVSGGQPDVVGADVRQQQVRKFMHCGPVFEELLDRRAGVREAALAKRSDDHVPFGGLAIASYSPGDLASRPCYNAAHARPFSHLHGGCLMNVQQELLKMSSGYWLSQSLHVAARLKIADLLKDGPRSSDDLARATATQPHALYRLLRALASVNVFAESNGKFQLTPLAEGLRSDVPGSQRAMALRRGWNMSEPSKPTLRRNHKNPSFE